MQTTSIQQTTHMPLIDFAIEIIHERQTTSYLWTTDRTHAPKGQVAQGGHYIGDCTPTRNRVKVRSSGRGEILKLVKLGLGGSLEMVIALQVIDGCG